MLRPFVAASLLVSIALAGPRAFAQAEPLPALPPPAAPPSSAPPPAPPPPAVAVPEAPPAAPLIVAEAPPAPPLGPPEPHHGFYLRFTTTLGFMSAFGTNPAGGSASISGLLTGGNLAIGGSVAHGLVVAGVLGGVSASGDFSGGPFVGDSIATGTNSSVGASQQATANLGIVGALVDWYPDPRGSWHAGAMVGGGFFGVHTDADDGTTSAVDFVGSLFAGYDVPIGPRWALGIGLSATGATPATLLDSNGNTTGYRFTPLSVGLDGSLVHF